MSDQTPEDQLKPYVPAGTHLGYSKGGNGTYRAMLFEDGTNRLLGPAELIERDDYYASCDTGLAPEIDVAPAPWLSEEEAKQLAEVLLAVGVWAAPHVKRLWDERRARTVDCRLAGASQNAAKQVDGVRSDVLGFEWFAAWVTPPVQRVWGETLSPSLRRGYARATAGHRLDWGIA